MGSNTSTNVKIQKIGDGICKTKNSGGSIKQTCSSIIEIDNINYTDEEWDQIKKDKSKEIDFCVMEQHPLGLEECMGLFGRDSDGYVKKLDQFVVYADGSPCWTFFYRPGSVIPNVDLFKRDVSNRVIQGKKCRIVYTDYDYDDDELERCCYSDNHDACNKNLINDYSTNHCNTIMVKKCSDTPDNKNCIKWLLNTGKRSNDIALLLYEKYCKENHDDPVCSYFCIAARSNVDYRSSYCDNALNTWCSNNQSYDKCHCVITPLDKVPDLEKYLGPKECWLEECSSLLDNKWMTTDQIEKKLNCRITSCNINIKSLILNDDATAELINNCIAGTNVSNLNIIDQKTWFKKKIIKTPGFLLTPELSIIFLSGILLLL